MVKYYADMADMLDNIATFKDENAFFLFLARVTLL